MADPASATQRQAHAARWDVFCRVIDNYGDAGVAWRLARELRHEHGMTVTLWIDDLRALAAMAGVDPEQATQCVHGIEVRARDTWTNDCVLPAVVVEVLECGLPPGYLDAMRDMPQAPQWFVLEYLSAETWIDDSHALASPHPASGLARRFWFPGFTVRTGGLLRERDLVARRDAFMRDEAAQSALWQSLDVAPLPHATRVSLFCYRSAPVVPLLEAWRAGSERIECFVPDGVAVGAIREWAGGATPQVGAPLARDAVTLRVLPFVAQERYDELLWSCDFNFVRGEDSFVRAQWAARPFAWHVYPQEQEAHLVKLEAFLARYAEGLQESTAKSVNDFCRAWNARDGTRDMAAAWHVLARHAGALRMHAQRWASYLETLPELATTLVQGAGFGV